MGLLKARTRLSAIGLDIDAHEFRAVQLVQGTGGVTPLAWAVFPRRGEAEAGVGSAPEPEEISWAVSILGRRGFVGSAVSVAPTTADCSSHVFELPPADSGAPLGQLARMEVARARNCTPGDFEMGFWQLPAKGRSQETLGVACPRTVIDSMIDRYRQGGLETAGIDLMELAIFRGACAGGAVPGPENEINATLHVGWATSLAVLSLGDTVVYVRRIERGASSVWSHAGERYRLSRNGCQSILCGDRAEHPQFEKIRKACWSSLSGELSAELDVAIAYVSHAFRMAPLGTIRMSGYGAGNPVVEEQLDKVLGIPVVHAAPVSLISSAGDSPEGRSLASRLTAAYGLAERFDR